MTTIDHHASRRLECEQLRLAIAKTEQRIIAAQDELSKAHKKLTAQQAELRFQEMILKIPFAK